jgi:hypothetical protein
MWSTGASQLQLPYSPHHTHQLGLQHAHRAAALPAAQRQARGCSSSLQRERGAQAPSR